MITTIFQKKSSTYHISKSIIGRFFPILVLVRSLQSSFIDSFSFAKKRCNISQGFGAFYVQSCDRWLFPFISFLSLSFFFLFLDFIVISDFFFNETIILLGLAGYQMIITNLARYLSFDVHSSPCLVHRRRFTAGKTGSAGRRGKDAAVHLSHNTARTIIQWGGTPGAEAAARPSRIIVKNHIHLHFINR